MKVITLIGKTNSGKTSSLKYCFLEMLGSNDFKLVWKGKHFFDDKEEIKKDILDNWKTKSQKGVSDISGVFKYKGKHIFVVSIGDSITDIRKQLENRLYQYPDIDMFICSRHEEGQIYKDLALRNLTISEIPIIKDRASNPDEYDCENKKSGKEVFDKIIETYKALK